MSVRIDVLVVLHNSLRFLPALLESLRTITVPVKVYFLDNNSRDESANLISQHISELPFPAFLTRSLQNNGFARGMNMLARMSSSPFLFILNPDTIVQPGAVEALLARAESDERIGICEARQAPREHPKFSDARTGETSWCSGAAALLRRKAFDEAGGFDDQLFFMYCEDVDLSWKFWLRGWKCIYVREAVVSHFTQDLTPGKRRTLENYLTFRNSLFLYYRYRSSAEPQTLKRFLFKRFLTSSYTFSSKLVFGFALIDHIRYIPHLLQTRNTWSGGKHPWIRFEETSLSR